MVSRETMHDVLGVFACCLGSPWMMSKESMHDV